MSWSLTLKADRHIKERDVVRALPSIGEDLSKFPGRQSWGWSSLSTGLGVDVSLPKGQTLTLSGAYYSAHLAEKAAEKVALSLRSLGYDIIIESRT
jgi:hypothetical protein